MVTVRRGCFGILSAGQRASYVGLLALLCGGVGSACDGAASSSRPPERAPQGGQGGAGAASGHGGSDIITIPPPGPRPCGNLSLDPDEECDDGNRQGGDGCDSSCKLEQCPRTVPCLRGDGILDPDEDCDDGNVDSGDGCTPSGTVEDGWVCPLPGKPCRVRCGDRKVRGSETCDDGNTVNGDGCARNCQLEPVCGAGSGGVPALEEGGAGGAAGASGDSGGGGVPESGAPAGAGGDASICTPAVCGDGIVGGDEQCDEGSSNRGDYGGCRADCTYGSFCGDSHLDPGETCDAGVNTTHYGLSGCAPGCVPAHFCGDGIVDVHDGESCDSGPTSTGSCRRCQLYAGP
jgi:cysteine-rich repeat protein